MITRTPTVMPGFFYIWCSNNVMKHIFYNRLLLFLLVCSLGPALITSCDVDDGGPIAETGDDDEIVTAYARKKLVEHTHKKGVDPCPHNFNQSTDVPVFCYEGFEFEACEVDSAVIVNLTPAIKAVFTSNNQTSTKLPAIDMPVYIDFTLTCDSLNGSFDHDFGVDFYENGKWISQETIEVKVTVE